MEVAASYGALGFWLFLAAVVVSGIWFEARKRESQQETLRRIVESGQQIDAAIIDKLLASSGGSRIDQDLKIGGLITLSVAPGLAILGYFLGKLEDGLFGILLGVSLLVGLIGAGLLLAGKLSERWYNDSKG